MALIVVVRFAIVGQLVPFANDGRAHPPRARKYRWRVGSPLHRLRRFLVVQCRGWIGSEPLDWSRSNGERTVSCCSELSRWRVFAVDSFRRIKLEPALDPREAERVRLCLIDGARRRMKAVSDGEPYSTYPTIPPPPSGWMADLAVYDELLKLLLRRTGMRESVRNRKPADSRAADSRTDYRNVPQTCRLDPRPEILPPGPPK